MFSSWRYGQKSCKKDIICIQSGKKLQHFSTKGMMTSMRASQGSLAQFLSYLNCWKLSICPPDQFCIFLHSASCCRVWPLRNECINWPLALASGRFNERISGREEVSSFSVDHLRAAGSFDWTSQHIPRCSLYIPLFSLTFKARVMTAPLFCY